MPLPVCCPSARPARRRLASAGMALLFVAGGARLASAAPAAYLVDVWGTEKNLPNSTVTSIAQTPDGYLWLGTYDGLARFDGSRFVTFDHLNHARIQELDVDVTGTLWINTFRGGLTALKNGVFRRELPDQAVFDLHTRLVSSSSNAVVFVTQFGTVFEHKLDGPGEEPARGGHGPPRQSSWNTLTPPGEMRPLFQCVDRNGILWFLSREGNIIRVVDKEFTALPENGGLGSKRVLTLVADARGAVWAGAENEIGRWNGSRFETMTPTNGEANYHRPCFFPPGPGRCGFWTGTGCANRRGGSGWRK